MRLRHVWRLILWIILLNAVLAPPLFLLEGYIRSDTSIRNFIRDYGSHYPNVFEPTEGALVSFFRLSAITPLKEEILARGPLWLFLILIGRIAPRCPPRYVRFAAFGLLFVPTWFLAVGHPVVLPVFVAGILWGFLVYKTRRFWPSLFCHVVANVLSYLGALIEMKFHLIGI